MTTGSVTTGPWSFTEKLFYAKAWIGGDGYVQPDKFSHSPKWNPYQMASTKFRSSAPDRIGTRTTPTGPITVATNNSFYTLIGPIGATGEIPATFPESSFNARWTAREELALLTKMLNKVRGHELDLGVSLAEVDKLAGTVLGTIKNLVYMADDVRRLKFAQAARRFGARPPKKDRVEKLRTLDISGRFLEMRYAWEPTINDVFEAAKAFEMLSNGPRSSYNRATKRKRFNDTGVSNYGKHSRVIEVRRSYLYEFYEEMTAARQLGLANPATVVWERLPWSFVFDWFIPIGTYLTLIGQIPHMEGRWCRTSSMRVSGSGPCPADPSVGGYYPAPPHPACEYERFYLQRYLLGSPPFVPLPNFKVQGAIHGKRVANAIALGFQVASKIVGGRDAVDDYVPDVNLDDE